MNVKKLPRLEPTHRRMLLAHRVAELQTAVGDALVAAAPHPDFEAMARKASPWDQVSKAKILTAVFEFAHSRPWRDHLATVQLNGMALGLWAAKRDGLPIIPAHRLPVRASFKEVVADISTPEKAIQYWRDRALLSPEQVATLRDALNAFYSSTFAVAGEYSDAIMSAVAELFTRALTEGMSLSAFRESFSTVIPGKSRSVLESIYRTQLSKNFGLQRIAGIRRGGPLAAPFLEWLAVGDDRTRATHQAMSGFVASLNDPIWSVWSVPAGFQCRCNISPVPYLEAVRRKWAEFTPDRRSLTFPMGSRPRGDPPSFVYDSRRKMLVRVQPDPGFEGGGYGSLASIIAA